MRFARADASAGAVSGGRQARAPGIDQAAPVRGVARSETPMLHQRHVQGKSRAAQIRKIGRMKNGANGGVH
jgi:hypothetical protein